MSQPPCETVRIDLGRSTYTALVGQGLLATGLASPGAAGLGALAGLRAIVVADAGVPVEPVGLVLSALREQGLSVITIEVAADEKLKTLGTVERIVRAMGDARFERGDLLVALGGGIVGDLAGFAAAVYRRGIRWIQCPTTLLSMVDASVGGKTGVNAVGAFHQPSLVLADVDVLGSLPDRELRCGLAECIKHAILGPGWQAADLMTWLDGSLPRILARDPNILTEMVARNVRVKARVVAADEREEVPGIREQLNLGHTFGHALEALSVPAPERTGGGRLHHGEAVALGLIGASVCAGEFGLGQTAAAIRGIVARAGLPTAAAIPESAKVLAAMRHDKKARGGRLRLVLPTAGGGVVVRDDVPDAVVLRAIDALRV